LAAVIDFLPALLEPVALHCSNYSGEEKLIFSLVRSEGNSLCRVFVVPSGRPRTRHCRAPVAVLVVKTGSAMLSSHYSPLVYSSLTRPPTSNRQPLHQP